MLSHSVTEMDESWISLFAAVENVRAYLRLRQSETDGLVTEPPVSSPDERGGALDRSERRTATASKGQGETTVAVSTTEGAVELE